ncbi:MAG: hypothetical protein ABI601_10300 [bacterium]
MNQIGLAVPISSSLLISLALQLGIGAVFGAVAWQLGRRYGLLAVFLSWLIGTLAFGAAYSARVLHAWSAFGIPPDRYPPRMVFAIFTVLGAFTLGFPALSVARRLRRAPAQRMWTVVRAAAGLAFAGGLLAIAAGVLTNLGRMLDASVQ